jgi:hypothetical protein
MADGPKDKLANDSTTDAIEAMPLREESWTNIAVDCCECDTHGMENLH